MSITKQASVVDTIDSMLASIDARVGAEKRAEESNTEAGGYQGPTTHPVKNEDDSTEDATEGARSQENSEDVKADQGPPSVDSTSEKGASRRKQALGDQDKVQLNIGTNQAATGEDSKVETSSAKGGKDDDGYKEHTSHPAATDNDEIDGHKYASSIHRLRAAIKQASDIGNDALAAISVESQDEIKKQAQAQLKDRGQDPAKLASQQKKASAKQAGANLADAVTGTGSVDGHDKQAEAAQVVDDVAQTLLTAYAMADKTAQFLGGYFEGVKEQEKKAKAQGGQRSNFPKASAEKAAMPPEDAADAPEDSSEDNGDSGESKSEGGSDGGGESGGGEGLPPMDEGGMPGMEDPMAGGGDEAALLEALLGGGMPPEAGGDPMMGGGMPPGGGDVPGAEDAMAGMMGGMPPEGGGMPPEEGGMPPEAGGGDEMAMLQAALAEAGIPPEALEATAAAKAAKDLKAYQAKQASAGKVRKSDWRPKTAEQAKRYQATLNYIKELCGQG